MSSRSAKAKRGKLLPVNRRLLIYYTVEALNPKIEVVLNEWTYHALARLKRRKLKKLDRVTIKKEDIVDVQIQEQEENPYVLKFYVNLKGEEVDIPDEYMLLVVALTAAQENEQEGEDGVVFYGKVITTYANNNAERLLKAVNRAWKQDNGIFIKKRKNRKKRKRR